jgi:hypothetical protein
MDKGPVMLDGKIVQQVLRRETIAGVDDDIVVGEEPCAGGSGHALDPGLHDDPGIEPGNEGGGGLGLSAPEVGDAKQGLAVEVRALDDIVVTQREVTHPGGGELRDHGRTKPTTPDDGDTSRSETTLTGDAHLRQDKLAVMAVGKRHSLSRARRLDEAKAVGPL